MKPKIYFILLLLIMLAACQKEHTGRAVNTLSGKWKLVTYHNLLTGTSEAEPSTISRSIVLTFADDRVQGTMHGHTVTNTVSGAYVLLENRQMKVVSFGGTKTGEPDWGARFWDAIHAASSYQIQGQRLSIYFNSDTEKLAFNKQ